MFVSDYETSFRRIENRFLIFCFCFVETVYSGHRLSWMTGWREITAIRENDIYFLVTRF